MRYAYELIANTNTSFFLTGRAGTGKTTFIRNVLETVDKCFVILAPTGIAALNAMGDTIHSFFGFPLCVLGPNDYGKMKVKNIKKVKGNPEMFFPPADTIIVDEVSMVRCDIMDGIDRMLVEILAVGVGVHHIGLRGSHLAQRTVVDGGIHLHPSRVEHGADEGVLLHVVVPQQHRNTQQLKGGYADERYLKAVADALCHAHSDAESRVGTWPAAHGNGVNRDGMTVGKRECFIHISAQSLGMIGTAEILFLEDDMAVFAHRHGTNATARFNM